MNALYGNPTIDENDDEEIDFDETQPDDDTPTSPAPEVNPTNNNPNDPPSDPPVTAPTFSRQPSKRAETSLVWQFFTQLREKNRAKCKTCGKELVFQYVGSRGGREV